MCSLKQPLSTEVSPSLTADVGSATTPLKPKEGFEWATTQALLGHFSFSTCSRQVEGEMTRQKIALDARPGGPAAKRQPSPEGLGNRSRRGAKRRRRGTKPTSSSS